MPASVAISHLDASFGTRVLFTDLNLVLAPGDIVAVVGPNGSGKSTLMQTVASQTPIEAGSIRLAPSDATVGYLPQTVPKGEETLLQYVRRLTGVAAADIELERSSQRLAEQLPGSDDSYSTALAKWLALGAADLEDRLPKVAAKVGLAVDPGRPLGTLSGGQAARVSLLAVLLSQYDVVLLDEPTNNLDMAGLDLMENFIRSHQAPVMIASHDRALLNSVATSVLELDIKQQRIEHYTGNYSDYLAARDLHRRHTHEEYEKYTQTRDALHTQARRRTEWASKGARGATKSTETDKHIKHRISQRADAQAGRAAQARRAVDRLESVEQPRKEWNLQYTIAEAAPSAKLVAGLNDAMIRRDGFTFGPTTIGIGAGERIALTGRNGSGKTTLLQALLGHIPLHDGRQFLGSRTSIGLIDQERSLVAGPGRLIDVVSAALANNHRTPEPAEVRTLLAKFGLSPDHVNRPCESLSMGERTRAMLAVLQANAVNFLILDEPTNHLDIEAIEQLSKALADFAGTVLMVSHDKALLKDIGITRWWEMTNGQLTSP